MNGTSRKLHGIAGWVVVLSLLLSACGTGSPAGPTPTPQTSRPTTEQRQAWDPEVLLPIIEAASALPEKKPYATVAEEVTEQGDTKVIQEKHSVLENRESVLYLGQNDDLLFPGAMIQGKDVYDFVYVPIIAARAPLALSLPLEGVTTTGEAIQVTIKDPSRLSNVRQGINDLLKRAVKPGTKLPAKFDYTYQQVYSESEKNLALGVSGSYASASMSYDFNWASETQKNKIISVYKQVYYTVDADLPAAPYDLFDQAAGVEAVAAALPAGSMPMYVSSVSYGWMAVLFIETDYSKDEMGMALDAAYDPAGDLSAKMSFGYSAKDVLRSSKIQIIVYGGSTSGITSDTLKGYSGLLQLIQGSKDFGADAPAVPLSFRLRHLSNNLIAKIALTEEYTVTRTVSLREFVNISAEKFTCTYDNDSSGALDMDRFYFSAKVYQGNNLIADQQLLKWEYGGELGMRASNTWTPNKKASTVVLLDMKHFDPSAYRIVLSASARDHDDLWEGNVDDWAGGSLTIDGDQIYDQSQNFFTISKPGDMAFDVAYSMQPSTEAECLTYPACKAQLDAWNGTPTATPTP